MNSLAEVDRAVLEPDGAINFTHKTPTPGEQRHEEIMRELRQIAALLAK